MYYVSRIKKVIFLVILTTYYLLLTTAPTSAAGLSLGVSPPILQIETQVPATIQTPITVENSSDEALELQILFKPFKAELENGEVSYLSPDESPGPDPLIFQKMQIFDNNQNIQSLTLAPGGQKTLTLQISLPKDEPGGDYYFSVVFLQNPQAAEGISEEKSSQSQIKGGIAATVLLSIGPKGKTTGVLEEFSVPFFLEKGPVAFTVRVKNTSRHFITPKGAILVKNMFGQTVGKVELLPVNILANTVRAIPDSLQSPEATPVAELNARRYTLDAPKALWNESFLLGPYTAALTLALSDQGPLFTKTIHFVGFPIQGIIGLLVALFLVILVRNRLKKRLS